MKKTVLLIGGAGAIGMFAAEELVKRGFKVDIITLDDLENTEDITYIKCKAGEQEYRRILSEKRYGAIVDFLGYSRENCPKYLELFCENTEQYIYLSSYRVYADEEHPITEKAPKLIDVYKDDAKMMEINTYPILKSQCENIIRASKYSNKITVVRPVIAFYRNRLSFITTQFHTLVGRAREGKKILVPEIARNAIAGYSFSGNVGKLLAHLVLNEKAYGEDFTLGTDENLTWGQIGEYLEEFLGCEFCWIDTESYLKYGVINSEGERYGLFNDRGIDRDVDISKVLSVTGLSRDDLMDTRSAIKQEVENLPEDIYAFDKGLIENNLKVSATSDEYLKMIGE